MKSLLSILLSFTISVAYAQEQTALECPNLGEDQTAVLQFSYDYGEPSNLGWTLAAISFVESSAGRHKVNMAGPAFGTYQILLSTASRRLGLTTEREINSLAQRLVEDDLFSARMAILELEFWIRLHGQHWSSVWASYYAGYNVSAGAEYARKISQTISMLRDCYFIVIADQ